jgi:hypothetical protein
MDILLLAIAYFTFFVCKYCIQDLGIINLVLCASRNLWLIMVLNGAQLSIAA